MENINERKDKKLAISFQTSKNLRTYVYGDTIDELIDGIEVLKDINFFNEFVRRFKKSLSNNQFSRLDDIVLKSGNAQQIVDYAILRGEDLEDILAFEDKIIALNNSKCIYLFARDGKNVNIQKMEKAILNSKDVRYWLLFLEYVKEANILNFKEALFNEKIDIGNAYTLYTFCNKYQNVEGLLSQEDIEFAENLVIKNGNFDTIYYFARDIENINITKLEDAIIQSANPYKIYEFAKLKGVNIEKMRNALYKTNDAFYIRSFKNKYEKPKRKFSIFTIFNK